MAFFRRLAGMVFDRHRAHRRNGEGRVKSNSLSYSSSPRSVRSIWRTFTFRPGNVRCRYPPDWELVFDDAASVRFKLTSFATEFFLIEFEIEDLSAFSKPLTLEQYKEMKKNHLLTLVPIVGFDVKEKATTFADEEGFGLAWRTQEFDDKEGKMLQFKFVLYAVIKNNTGYIVRYFAEEQHFDTQWPLAEKVMNTFSLLTPDDYIKPDSELAISTPTERLCQAIMTGGAISTGQLLAADSTLDLNTRNDEDGWTPLHLAAFLNDCASVDLLLAHPKPPSINALTLDGRTPLMLACQQGHADMVRRLIAAGANAQFVNTLGNSALESVAAFATPNTSSHSHRSGRYLECAKLLLQAGADPNTSNKRGITVLQRAALVGNLALVQLLLSSGAAPDRGEPPSALINATTRGHLQCVTSLLDAGAAINGPLSTNANLTAANETALQAAALFGEHDIAALLLARGAVVDAANADGKTPLQLACLQGHTDIASLLIGYGADIEHVDNEFGTPLHNAALYGRSECVRLLLRHGANPRRAGALGVSPLAAAAGRGHTACVRAIVDHAANSPAALSSLLEAAAEDGSTPLQTACLFGRVDAVDVLLAAGADVNHAADTDGSTPLHSAALKGSTECIKLLVKKGADVNKRAANHATPLAYAATSGNAGAVRALVAAGADVNARADDASTPLHSAALFGHTECVRVLCDSGADVNARADSDVTPILSAIQNNCVDVVRILIERGAEVNHVFHAERLTPLMLAALLGLEDCVRVLIEAGADVKATCRDGKTALALAQQNGKSDIARLLKKAYALRKRGT